MFDQRRNPAVLHFPQNIGHDGYLLEEPKIGYDPTMKMQGIVHSDREILGGTPVFVGTRVPLQNLIDSLEGGESIEDFFDGFPSVKREQVLAVIEAGKLAVLERIAHADSH